MKFKEVTEQELTAFFLSDPKLIILGLPDEELVYLHENKEFKCHPGSMFIEILEDDGTSVGVVRWEFFTQISIVIHVFLRSKYHGSNKLGEIYQFVYKHLQTNTNIRKVIAFISSSCIHVIKAVEKHGFKKDGSIPNCLIWREKVVGIEIYSVDIEEV